jgi:hypothetical protein
MSISLQCPPAERLLPNSLHELIIPKPDKDIGRNKKYGTIYLMNIDVKRFLMVLFVVMHATK